MSYDWKEYDDTGFEKMPVGMQKLQLFFVRESLNANDKPFLAFKFAQAGHTDEIEIDEFGNKNLYPHANLQVYYEAGKDFGKRVLKNLLKACFGEANLEKLTTNEMIIKTINVKMPLVRGLVYLDGDYCKLKEFEFKPVEDQPVSNAELPEPKEEKPKEEPPNEEDDLPF